MKDIEKSVGNSKLWQLLKDDLALISIISELRSISISISSEMNRIVPDYTDHSVKHMDGLWYVFESILNDNEFVKLSKSEAFILVCSFYIHDLGMAYGVLPEGLLLIEQSKEYASAYSLAIKKNDPDISKQIAIQYASRELHASNSNKLITEKIPSINRYLIENSDARQKWATILADVSESHNWPISVVFDKLGKLNKIPDPLGTECDLAFVACLLRITDYAHVNSDRASVITKMIRLNMPQSSKDHWEAQESINGPSRRNEKLVFASTNPIKNLDAWWLIYEMLTGLNREIIEINDFLNSRTVSSSRFSLEGVHGCINPQTFSQIIRTDGFEPIDVRFRPDSIERLVSILGGKQLYGNDNSAPVRELIQNAIDAIDLKKATSEQGDCEKFIGEIKVKYYCKGDNHYLEVEDNGIGMNQEVITNYLLGIASDFWNSPYFNLQYPQIKTSSFVPIGKFGIGFLSVFMLGDEIEVQTQKFASNNLVVNVHGVGTRGAIYKNPPKEKTGTRINILLSKISPAIFESLATIIKSRAPMINYEMKITTTKSEIQIFPGWWKHISQNDFYDFIATWRKSALSNNVETTDTSSALWNRAYRIAKKFSNIEKNDKWIGEQPELIGETYRVLAIPGINTLLLCNKGIAVREISISGICGIANVSSMDLSASRNQILEFDVEAFREKILKEMFQKILESLDGLVKYGMIQEKYPLVVKVAQEYGSDLLEKTKFPWICILGNNGNTIFVNTTTFLEKLNEVKSIVIGFGANPWTLPYYARKLFTNLNESLLVPIWAKEQPNFGSYKDEGYIDGTLEEHFDISEFNVNADENHIEKAVFLKKIIDCVSSAFKLTIEEILNAKWIRSKDDYIIIKISKKS